MWLGAYDFLDLVPKGRAEDGMAFPIKYAIPASLLDR
jgi:hypothetical protein